MEVYGVIMAGGGGTRFWPLSRQKTPKQLLNLSGKEIMVNETIDRLMMSIPGKNQYIVTNAAQAPVMQQVTQDRILPGHILAEPSARNTAACIGYAALEILHRHGDGILCVTPSDAYVRDWPAFTAVLEQAVQAAEQNDKLVTIGITPTFAATGYGYIRYDKTEQAGAKTVQAFVEKPPLETARQYLAEGCYAWNSGIFVWRASTILRFFRQLLPQVWAELAKIEAALGTAQEAAVIQKVYPQIPGISIDYGIMEKAAALGEVQVVAGEFGWNDVGSWDMMTVLHTPDEQQNILLGDALAVESRGNIVYAGSRTVTLAGVENMVVVETPDAVMICPKEKAQDVKKIVDALKAQGRTELL